ncbi:hypothetical protein [Litoreibacter janthinus]|nr:hypothetical protein [Litoreibacter janthinus]
MLTDADLTEAGQIHQDRDEAQGAAFAGSGVPAAGGMIAFNKEGDAFVQPGTVFAQGKQGHFRLGATEKEGRDLSSAFALQEDLPNGPDLTKGLVYVDVWERPIMAHEQPYLADAGLHGAETSYRTRTLVQIKSLPEFSSVEDLPKALSGHPAFRAKGNAELSLKLAQTTTEFDACDPCAELISIDKVLPNALIRFEVISVERDGKGSLSAIRLAWSSENAEAVEPLDTRTALERDKAVYEYFSASTEAQLGYFHEAHVPARGAFSTDLSSDTPDDPTLPKNTPALGYTHVRRWDGMVRLPLDTKSKVTGPSAASAKPSVNTAEITLTTEFFTVQLEHGGKEMVAGDYWLAELRRYAPEDEQALLNGEPLGRPQPPLGPLHHFCPLGFSDSETLLPLPDTLRRRLSFPTLADLPAGHVSYDSDPDCDLLGGTETVQDALDRVCEIDATHVAFTPSDEACDTLKNSSSVDDALNALCRADDNKQLQLMLRTMMDWGVVCGLSAQLTPDGIELGGGVALDRNGTLHEVTRQTIKLDGLSPEQLLHAKDVKNFEAYSKTNDEICLALGVNGNAQTIFLAPAHLIYRDADLTLSDQVQICLQGKGALTKSELFEKLPDQPVRMRTLTKIHICLRNAISVIDNVELTSTEVKQGNLLLNELIDEYGRALKNSGDPLWEAKKNELQTINETLDKDLRDSGIKGSEGQRDLVSMTLRYAAIMKKDEEFRLDCLCDNVIPDCPGLDTNEWSLIPLACVTLSNYSAGKVAATDVCMMCCRKQANTPRSQRFYLGDVVGDILAGVKELCAEEQLRAEASPAVRLREWLREAGAAPWDPPYGTPLWPPKPTYGGSVTTTNSGQTIGGAASVLNQWQRADNPEIEDVTGKTVEDSLSLLKNAGFELSEPPVVSSIDELLALAPEGKPLLNRRPQKGDTVALLAKGETAIEFVVIKQAFFFGRLMVPLFTGTFLGGQLAADTTETGKRSSGSAASDTKAKDTDIVFQPGLLANAKVTAAAIAIALENQPKEDTRKDEAKRATTPAAAINRETNVILSMPPARNLGTGASATTPPTPTETRTKKRALRAERAARRRTTKPKRSS